MRAADGFTVPSARPPVPVAWQVVTWSFLVVTAVYALLLLSGAGVLYAADGMIDRILTDPAAVGSADFKFVLDLADLLQNLTLLWVWLYVAGFITWFASSRRTVRRLGHDRQEILGHWTYVVWRLGFVLVVVLSLSMGTTRLPAAGDRVAVHDAFISHSHAVMGYTAMRVALLALLCAYIVVVWRRLTRPAASPAWS